MDGYDELNAEDKAKIDAAFENGHVADEDIPDSARLVIYLQALG